MKLIFKTPTIVTDLDAAVAKLHARYGDFPCENGLAGIALDRVERHALYKTIGTKSPAGHEFRLHRHDLIVIGIKGMRGYYDNIRILAAEEQ